MRKRSILIGVLPSIFFITGCGDDTSGPPPGGQTDGGGDSASDGTVTPDSGSEAALSTDASDGSVTTDGSNDAAVTPDASDSGLDAGDAGQAPVNAVYTTSNSATGNAVLGFVRASDGTLTPMAAPFATGGNGSGASLGEQGAIAYDTSANRIYTVNAGDNSFSILPVNYDGTLGTAVKVSAASASLVGPKSITFSGNTLYVLYEGNVTTPSMIAGYTVTNAVGAPTATPIANSALPLSSTTESVDPAQIQFTPDGKWLVVTEKQSGGGVSVSGPGAIDTFGVDATGLATAKGSYPTASAGIDAGVQLTPYGFAFVGSYLIVSEAGSTGVGSYTYAGGAIAPVAPASGGSQFLPTDPAPCWVASASNWAYVANAKGPDVSGYTVSAMSGGLTNIGTRANAVVATTGKTVVTDAGPAFEGPNDEFVSADGKFLYVLNSAVPSIGIFLIDPDGTLTRVGAADYTPSAAGALPVGAVGIVAR
ncbi:MAG: hypothetical protein WBY94_29555 [Polyangiaceae bacterium]